jgi:hypothetical protein
LDFLFLVNDQNLWELKEKLTLFVFSLW